MGSVVDEPGVLFGKYEKATRRSLQNTQLFKEVTRPKSFQVQKRCQSSEFERVTILRVFITIGTSSGVIINGGKPLLQSGE